tara:strand:+ start:143 stop:310 length:168 start_codon:yes stop_codon:yes gene_type:complete
MKDIEAKNEKEAEKKALNLMLKQAKKENPYTEQLYLLDAKYTVDSDYYYTQEYQK